MYKSGRYQNVGLFHMLHQPRCIAPAAEGGIWCVCSRDGGCLRSPKWGEETVVPPGRHNLTGVWSWWRRTFGSVRVRSVLFAIGGENDGWQRPTYTSSANYDNDSFFLVLWICEKEREREKSHRYWIRDFKNRGVLFLIFFSIKIYWHQNDFYIIFYER